MKYCNRSYTAKTFYGVTFKPGEVHSVPGYIDNPKFIRVPDSTPETSDKLVKPISKTPVVEDKKQKPATLEKQADVETVDTNPINKED